MCSSDLAAARYSRASIQALRAQFPVNMDMVSTDSAGLNKRGETSILTNFGLCCNMFLHMFCDVHWIHTIQGRAFGVVSNIVAGVDFVVRCLNAREARQRNSGKFSA